MSRNDMVSVIIPAYNAAATISETLQCVRAQTHHNLDIIVIDDGSTDATARIAAEHAATDGRIRITSKENGGVASARNLGVAMARSDFLAFVDADDLWAKSKIERELAVLKEGGPSVGLVYSWSARIDGTGHVIDDSYRPRYEGKVLQRLVQGNFMGNGSCALVRRKAFDDAGGFEPGLRAAGFEGCEDMLFYCRIAEHHEFAVAPAVLVGYRITPDNMSSDGTRMLGSWLIMVEEVVSRHPELALHLRTGVGHFACWLLNRALATRRINQVPAILTRLIKFDAKLAAKVAMIDLPFVILEAARRKFRRWGRITAHTQVPSARRHFLIQGGKC